MVIIVRAELKSTGLWSSDDEPIVVSALGLSDRLALALDDWTAFYDEMSGDLADPDMLAEFVGQGFKIAHGIRRELKGSEVWFARPDTGELAAIELRRSR